MAEPVARGASETGRCAVVCGSPSPLVRSRVDITHAAPTTESHGSAPLSAQPLSSRSIAALLELSRLAIKAFSESRPHGWTLAPLVPFSDRWPEILRTGEGGEE